VFAVCLFFGLFVVAVAGQQRCRHLVRIVIQITLFFYLPTRRELTVHDVLYSVFPGELIKIKQTALALNLTSNLEKSPAAVTSSTKRKFHRI
jgi:hypothetical protein